MRSKKTDGPYGIKNRNHWWHVAGLGEENRMNQWAYKIGAEWWASKLNAAYADGRKSRDTLRETLQFCADLLDPAYEHYDPTLTNAEVLRRIVNVLKDDGECGK